MKRKIITGLFMLLLGTITRSTYAQDISADKVPADVSSAFKAKFPKAEKVKWEMENGKDYEAAFKINDAEQSAVFDAGGNWMETETEIKVSELPQAVSQSVAKQFSGYKINEAEKVEKKDGNLYEVELSKGKEILEVTLSPTGEVTEKKAKEENDK